MKHCSYELRDQVRLPSREGAAIIPSKIPGSACLSADAKAKVPALLARAHGADEIAASARLFCDGNRVRIVQALHLASELCVCDLAEVLALEQSLVSHHLRVLRDGGVIGSRRDGAWVYYFLAHGDEPGSVQRQMRAVIEGLSGGDRDEPGSSTSS